jgi:hypothetical protein
LQEAQNNRVNKLGEKPTGTKENLSQFRSDCKAQLIFAKKMGETKKTR